MPSTKPSGNRDGPTPPRRSYESPEGGARRRSQHLDPHPSRAASFPRGPHLLPEDTLASVGFSPAPSGPSSPQSRRSSGVGLPRPQWHGRRAQIARDDLHELAALSPQLDDDLARFVPLHDTALQSERSYSSAGANLTRVSSTLNAAIGTGVSSATTPQLVVSSACASSLSTATAAAAAPSSAAVDLVSGGEGACRGATEAAEEELTAGVSAPVMDVSAALRPTLSRSPDADTRMPASPPIRIRRLGSTAFPNGEDSGRSTHEAPRYSVCETEATPLSGGPSPPFPLHARRDGGGGACALSMGLAVDSGSGHPAPSAPHLGLGSLHTASSLTPVLVPNDAPAADVPAPFPAGLRAAPALAHDAADLPTHAMSTSAAAVGAGTGGSSALAAVDPTAVSSGDADSSPPTVPRAASAVVLPSPAPPGGLFAGGGGFRAAPRRRRRYAPTIDTTRSQAACAMERSHSLSTTGTPSVPRTPLQNASGGVVPTVPVLLCALGDLPRAQTSASLCERSNGNSHSALAPSVAPGAGPTAPSSAHSTSLMSTRSARYSHRAHGGSGAAGAACGVMAGCGQTLKELFPDTPDFLFIPRGRLYVPRDGSKRLGKGSYGEVMQAELYPPGIEAPTQPETPSETLLRSSRMTTPRLGHPSATSVFTSALSGPSAHMPLQPTDSSGALSTVTHGVVSPTSLHDTVPLHLQPYGDGTTVDFYNGGVYTEDATQLLSSMVMLSPGRKSRSTSVQGLPRLGSSWVAEGAGAETHASVHAAGQAESAATGAAVEGDTCEDGDVVLGSQSLLPVGLDGEEGGGGAAASTGSAPVAYGPHPRRSDDHGSPSASTMTVAPYGGSVTGVVPPRGPAVDTSETCGPPSLSSRPCGGDGDGGGGGGSPALVQAAGDLLEAHSPGVGLSPLRGDGGGSEDDARRPLREDSSGHQSTSAPAAVRELNTGDLRCAGPAGPTLPPAEGTSEAVWGGGVGGGGRDAGAHTWADDSPTAPTPVSSSVFAGGANSPRGTAASQGRLTNLPSPSGVRDEPMSPASLLGHSCKTLAYPSPTMGVVQGLPPGTGASARLLAECGSPMLARERPGVGGDGVGVTVMAVRASLHAARGSAGLLSELDPDIVGSSVATSSSPVQSSTTAEAGSPRPSLSRSTMSPIHDGTPTRPSHVDPAPSEPPACVPCPVPLSPSPPTPALHTSPETSVHPGGLSLTGAPPIGGLRTMAFRDGCGAVTTGTVTSSSFDGSANHSDPFVSHCLAVTGEEGEVGRPGPRASFSSGTGAAWDGELTATAQAALLQGLMESSGSAGSTAATAVHHPGQTHPLAEDDASGPEEGGRAGGPDAVSPPPAGGGEAVSAGQEGQRAAAMGAAPIPVANVGVSGAALPAPPAGPVRMEALGLYTSSVSPSREFGNTLSTEDSLANTNNTLSLSWTNRGLPTPAAARRAQPMDLPIASPAEVVSASCGQGHPSATCSYGSHSNRSHYGPTVSNMTDAVAAGALPFRSVAVKTFSKSMLGRREFWQAFHNEMVVASQLRHPCLVNIFGVVDEPDRVLLVMDLAENGNVDQYMKKFGKRESREMAPRFVADLVLALEYLQDGRRHAFKKLAGCGDGVTGRRLDGAPAAFRPRSSLRLRRGGGTPPQREGPLAASTTGNTSGQGASETPSGSSSPPKLMSITALPAGVTVLPTGVPAVLAPPPPISFGAVTGEGGEGVEGSLPVGPAGSGVSTVVATRSALMEPDEGGETGRMRDAAAERDVLDSPESADEPSGGDEEQDDEEGEDDATSNHTCLLTEEELWQSTVVHRDIKPENLLLTWDYHVKLGDFGNACFLGDEQANRFGGTAAYIAPEVLLSSKAGPYSDLWSLGCVVFELVEGRPAFTGATQYLITCRIKAFLRGEEGLPFTEADGAGEEEEDGGRGDGPASLAARDLVRRLLVARPEDRLGAPAQGGFAALKAHPFFCEIDWSTLLETSNINPTNTDYTEELQGYLGDEERVLYCSPVEVLRDSSALTKLGVADPAMVCGGGCPKVLVLTDEPQLFLVDPESDSVAFTVPWSHELTVQVERSELFSVSSPAMGRLRLRDRNRRADLWGLKVSEVVAKTAKTPETTPTLPRASTTTLADFNPRGPHLASSRSVLSLSFATLDREVSGGAGTLVPHNGLLSRVRLTPRSGRRGDGSGGGTRRPPRTRPCPLSSLPPAPPLMHARSESVSFGLGTPTSLASTLGSGTGGVSRPPAVGPARTPPVAGAAAMDTPTPQSILAAPGRSRGPSTMTVTVASTSSVEARLATPTLLVSPHGVRPVDVPVGGGGGVSPRNPLASAVAGLHRDPHSPLGGTAFTSYMSGAGSSGGDPVELAGDCGGTGPRAGAALPPAHGFTAMGGGQDGPPPTGALDTLASPLGTLPRAVIAAGGGGGCCCSESLGEGREVGSTSRVGSSLSTTVTPGQPIAAPLPLRHSNDGGGAQAGVSGSGPLPVSVLMDRGSPGSGEGSGYPILPVGAGKAATQDRTPKPTGARAVFQQRTKRHSVRVSKGVDNADDHPAS